MKAVSSRFSVKGLFQGCVILLMALFYLVFTQAWIARADVLLSNGNENAWRNLMVMGTVATGLLPAILVGLALTRNRFHRLTLASAFIYAFMLSNIMLAFLGFAYNL